MRRLDGTNGDGLLIGEQVRLDGTVSGDRDLRHGSHALINRTVEGVVRVARGASARLNGTAGEVEIARGGYLRVEGTVRGDVANQGQVDVCGTVRGSLITTAGRAVMQPDGRVLDRLW